jgi:uncharacterized protein (TIGR02145 family)
MNTWGLSVDGGANYLTLPNGVVGEWEEVLSSVVDENLREFMWGLLLAEGGAMDSDDITLPIVEGATGMSVIDDGSHAVLLAWMNAINQGLGEGFFSQNDIDMLSPKYTNEEIITLFFFFSIVGSNPNTMTNDELRNLLLGLGGVEEFIIEILSWATEDIPVDASEAWIASRALNVLRKNFRVSLGSTQSLFLQHRQMLTIKNQPSPIVNDLTPITAGINIDHSILPGYYSTQVEFTAVPNDVPVPIIRGISPNSGSAGTVIAITGVNFLHNSNPLLYQVRIGESLCDNLTIVSNTSATCEVPAGMGGVARSFTATSVYGDEFHTVISFNVIPDYNGANFADVDPATCNTSIGIGTIFTVNDPRNGQDYRIRCMEDGHYWMIDNLKIADYTATSADSNVSSSFVIPATKTSGAENNIEPQVWDPSGQAYCTSGIGGAFTTDPGNPAPQTGCGYLYNFWAATAGTGQSISSGTAPSSICPKNWRLPTGTASSEFNALQVSMGMPSGVLHSGLTLDNNRWILPNGYFRATMSGYYNNGDFSNSGSTAMLWSSRSRTVESADGMSLMSAPIMVAIPPDPGAYTNKKDGAVVRCRR